MPHRAEDLATLGLSGTAAPTESEIKKAYFKAVLIHHPDKGGRKEDFQRLVNAFERLSGTASMPSPSSGAPQRAQRQGQPPQAGPSSGFRGAAPPPHGCGHDSDSDNDSQWYNCRSRCFHSDSDTDSEWYDDHFGFFRNFFTGPFWRGAASGSDAGFAHFSAWAQDKAKRRAANVKAGYDHRDVKLAGGRPPRTGRPPRAVCTTCRTNAAISKQDARASGVDWGLCSGHPRYKTCWACKNRHASVLTQAMAVKKYPVLRAAQDVFQKLRQQRKYFPHRPVAEGVAYTRESWYYWAPDLEEEARARGWRPRGAPGGPRPEPPKCPRPRPTPKKRPREDERSDSKGTPQKRGRGGAGAPQAAKRPGATPGPADEGQGVPQEPNFCFFLLPGPTLTDRPQGPPTANRQPLPTVTNRQPPPTPTNHQSPTTNPHQPPIANHQPPPTTNRQPPTPTNHQSSTTNCCQPPPTANHRQPWWNIWATCSLFAKVQFEPL